MLRPSTMAQTLQSLQGHLRTPLYRNGYALVANAMTTSALGAVFWILAARNYSTEAVGINAALISAMMLLASLAQLNLHYALNRFIPTSGNATRRLIGYTYLVTLPLALVTSTIFVLGLRIWSPQLSVIGSSALFVAGFVGATMGWSIFVLQDSALIGLRKATWVPVENLAYSVAKIILLIGLAGALSTYGIFISWTIPLIFLIVPINVLIFWRLIPRHVIATQSVAKPLVRRHVMQYAAGDYFASLLWAGATDLLPIIVLTLAGATANAYFYLAWTITYTLYLVSTNMGMSLITEASLDSSRLHLYGRRALIQTARILIPVVVMVVIGAPVILSFFGPEYAEGGSTALRLLALSALPYIVTSTFISMARVQRRMKALVVVQGALSALVITLSVVLLPLYGLEGVASAWLISQTVIATGLLLTELRMLWPFESRGRVRARLASIYRALLNSGGKRRAQAGLEELLPAIRPALSTLDAGKEHRWEIREYLSVNADMTIAALAQASERPTAVLKLAHNATASRGLKVQQRVLAQLKGNQSLGHWRCLTPTLLSENEVAGCYYTLEQLLPGRDARCLLDDPYRRSQFLVHAAESIAVLHRHTSVEIAVDASTLERWVDEPLSVIRHVKRRPSSRAVAGNAIDRLSDELHVMLDGRTVTTSWVHGDYWLGNLLVAADGSTLCGIIDWDLAQPAQLPQMDLLHLLTSTRALVERRELGAVIQDLLTGGVWEAHERDLLEPALASWGGDELPLRGLLLLAWLRHVSSNLKKSERYNGHRMWLAWNVAPVLNTFEKGTIMRAGSAPAAIESEGRAQTVAGRLSAAPSGEVTA